MSGADAAMHRAVAYDPATAARYRDAGWWTGETMCDWIARRATDASDRIAMIGPDGAMTYAALATAADRLAGSLRGLGIGAGDVIGIQLRNRPEYLIAHVAAARMGAVLTTIHMSYRAAEAETLLAHGRARAVICERTVRDYQAAAVMLDLAARLDNLEQVIVMGDAPAGAVSLEALIAAGVPADLGPVPAGDDPFLLLYTSGTSNSPKAVPHNHDAMMSNARLTAPEFGATAADVILAAGPFSHLYALLGVHIAFWTGAANLLLPSYSPAGLAETIARDRPTVLFAVPAHVANCLNEGLFETHDTSSLRLVIVAGAAVPPDLMRALDAALPNGRVAQLWGMTEMQAGLYTRPGDTVEIAATSCGRPSPGTEIRLLDGAGAPVAAGTPGQLQVRGCSVFPRYFGNDDANAEAFTDDGWFRTGDVAVADAAGNVTISGRTKDIINRGGVKYSPREIEDLLHRHPDIVEAAIVPMPDAVLGEKACCFAVPVKGAAVTLEDVCAFLVARGIASHKLPERLEILDSMPLGPTRKVIKELLKPRGD